MNNNLQTRNLLLLSGGLILLMLSGSAWAWNQLPADAQIPLHWNAAGEVDRWGGKLEGLFLLPAITAGLALLLAVVPRIDPRRSNLAQSQKAYGAVWIGTILLMVVIHGFTIATAMGSTVNIARVVPIAVGALFVVIGNYMGKIRSNFHFGIRTPWTLSSELSWNKTHRLGGRLFMVLGLLLIVVGLVGGSGQWLLPVLLGGVGLVTVIPFAYSYVVWKNDPDVQVG